MGIGGSAFYLTRTEAVEPIPNRNPKYNHTNNLLIQA